MKILWVLPSSIFLLITLLFPAQPGYTQVTGNLTPTPGVEVASEMDFVPADCGQLAEPIAIDPLIPQAVGAWPIWIALPNWTGATKGILVVSNQHNHPEHQLDGWWFTKAAWFVDKSYVGEVRIRGVNLADNSPIYFDFSSDEPHTVASLNPDQPGGFVTGLDELAFFPSGVWVSDAGCYRLEAEWDGGRWQQIIAVSRPGQ
ncbi:MAG: hypothetical protein HZC41_23005 [Chloroflexi bacterium]|nr:hypothetical protein [Chloroflexota bacterium]